MEDRMPGDVTVDGKGLEKAQKKTKLKKKSTVREYAEAIFFAIILTMIIRTFVIQAFRIPTGSMEETLLVGDFLFVNKFLYGASVPFTDWRLPAIRKPRAGDIIVFKFPEDQKRDFIKRVVAAAGDTLQIIDKVVHINGVAQEQGFVKFTNPHILPSGHRDPNVKPSGAGNRDNFGPYVIPEHHFFMMGDNRDNSDDSRFWGPLHEDLIKGKALFIYWSWNKQKNLPRVGRLGKLIH